MNDITTADDVNAVRAVLGRYVRATDHRDGAAQGALFTDDAEVRIFTRSSDGTYEPVGEPLIGASGVKWAVENIMEPHPPGGSSHHMTADHLIEVDGDAAHLSAQFVVFQSRALPERSLLPIESGYYDTDLRKVDNEWRIIRHHVLLDLPLAAVTA